MEGHKETRIQTAFAERSAESSDIAALDIRIDADLAGLNRARLTRREVLLGAVSVASLASLLATPDTARSAPAESERPISPERSYSPEQLTAYSEGLSGMRQSATHDSREAKKYFVARRDGTSEWIDPNAASSTQSDKTVFDGAGLIITPAEIRNKMMELVKEGAIVEDLHTHPTALMSEGARDYMRTLNLTPYQLNMHRVPPSPSDFFYSLRNTPLDSEGDARFTVVDEAGVWRHGPRSLEAAKRLWDALDKSVPTINLLKTYTKEREELAGYLERKSKDETHTAYQRKWFAEIADQLGQGTYEEGLRGLPLSSTNAQFITFFLSDTHMPEGARRYVRLLERAMKDSEAAFVAISPSISSKLGMLPNAAAHEDYVERWRSLGFRVDFEPF